MKKYDERDTLFSRVGLKKGSKDYKEYYKKNPKTKQDDDRVRGVTFRRNIRKSEYFKDLFLPITASNKEMISSIFNTARKKEVSATRVIPPKDFHNNIKEITKHYGAVDVGIVKMTDDLYYSNYGNLSQHVGIEYNYGEKIFPKYNSAIVFTILMDKDMINRAPHYEELMATEDAYLHVALTGARLEMYIKSLGYKAESTNGEYYIGPLVPLAYEGGLGEIGMSNHIVTKEYGDRVRLGAVYTTLEFDEYDFPIDYGLQEFCTKCALCLMNCPSQAIKHGKRDVNGRPFYKFDDNKCYEVWTKMGTDCGTCIQACPFSQGVRKELADNMKGNTEVMDQIMKEHFDTYGRRNYIKKDLKIVRIGEEDE
jgi:ferredoxin